MRAAASTVARGALLLGPVALAFATGGFTDGPRLAALGVAAIALMVLALALPTPLVAGRGAWAAVLALSAFAGWVALSRTWAPLADPAGDDAERVLLYAVAFAAGVAAWRDPRAARLVEPAAWVGIALVASYALGGRLLPELVAQTPSLSAIGRLEQPLTYWNALGLLCAMGTLLGLRLAGEPSRPAALRALAAGSVPALAVAVYLTYSRGAAAALLGGLIALLVLAATRRAWRAVAVGVGTGALAVALVAPFDAVGAGTVAQAPGQGRVFVAVLVALGAATAAATALLDRAAAGGPRGEERIALPRLAGPAAALVVVALVVVPVLASDLQPQVDGAVGATNERFTQTGSNRYLYWDVALDAFAADPLVGSGSGAFRVAWLRERTIGEAVVDAHSLELETLAELGLVGAALLAAWLTAVGLRARRAQRADPTLAAGPAAACTAFLMHASIDWDWELPAVTLVALGLAAVLVARGERPAPA